MASGRPGRVGVPSSGGPEHGQGSEGAGRGCRGGGRGAGGGVPGAGDEDGPGRTRGAGTAERVPGSQAPVTPAADEPDPSVRQAQEECRKEQRTSCYTFDQLRTVYGVKELKATGKGQTVAVVMPVGSPVLETDLRAFSEKLRLAAPQIEVVRHAPDSGEAAPFDWDSDVMVSQAKDTTLAVQAVHAMAPEAKVVLHQVDAAPGEADEGLTADGARRLADVARQVVEDDSADVLSVSFAVPEKGELGRELRTDFKEMAPSSSTRPARASPWSRPPGTAAPPPPRRTASPYGGLLARLRPERLRGRRAAPRSRRRGTADRPGRGLGRPRGRLRRRRLRGLRPPLLPEPGRAGRRRPERRARPRHDRLRRRLDHDPLHRGRQDPHLGPDGRNQPGRPLFAGIVADADQEAGDRVGRLHHHLYEMGRDVDAGRKAGLLDVTHGTNGDDGHRATRGYDLASGLGTLDASLLVPALTDR